MKDTIIEKVAELWPALLSGLMIILAFPALDIYPVAWLALVPLLLSLWEKNAKKAFWTGYAFGVIYFFGTVYWIYHSISVYGGISFWASLVIVFLLCLYLAVYPGIFSLIFAVIIRKTKLPAVLVAPVFWVVLEFIRSYALTGFPWSSMGYSQYRFLTMIQVSDITGIYGISFLVVAVNGAIADLFLLKRRLRQMPLFPVSYTIVGIFSLCFIIAASLGYGAWKMSEARNGNSLPVSIVQGNIEQDRKWDPAYQEEVLDIYSGLSRAAAVTSPGLIVWPETSVPFFFNSDAEYSGKVTGLGQDLGSYLLFGSVLVKERTKAHTLLTNSAVLLDRAGKTAYTYDKIHLVPFGEYVPLRSVLFFIDKVVSGIGDYIPGDQYEQAETDFGSFGTLICYEIIFPGLVRKFYTDGGDFIVNITNDAWFGKTNGPYQHFSMAVFRAIENRKPVVRAANTGISGLIDSNGRILSSTSLFERKVLSGTIKTDRTMTFYTKYGDLFSYLCIVLSIVLIMNIRLWR